MICFPFFEKHYIVSAQRILTYSFLKLMVRYNSTKILNIFSLRRKRKRKKQKKNNWKKTEEY